MELETLSVRDLLALQSSAIAELKSRGVVRTRNNPIGDYAEWLVASALGFILNPNSSSVFDGLSLDGTRFQIKGRRVSKANKSRKLIRNYEKREFDLLAAVVFSEDYSVREALLVPHGVVGEYAAYREHVNGHVFHLRGAVTVDPAYRAYEST